MSSHLSLEDQITQRGRLVAPPGEGDAQLSDARVVLRRGSASLPW